MNILVTGGCGFVGSSICTYLKKKNKNLNILSVDNLSKIYSKYNQRNLKKNKINNKIINVGNIKKFQNLKFKADFIIDCSAEPSVEASRKNISKVIESNFLSTLNVLEKAKRDKSKVIFLSSISGVSNALGYYGKSKFQISKILSNNCETSVLICGLIITDNKKTPFYFLKNLFEKLPFLIKFGDKVKVLYTDSGQVLNTICNKINNFE